MSTLVQRLAVQRQQRTLALGQRVADAATASVGAAAMSPLTSECPPFFHNSFAELAAVQAMPVVQGGESFADAVDVAYYTAYPNAPAIPEGWENSPSCQPWGEAWLRIRGLAKRLGKWGPKPVIPTRPPPAPAPAPGRAPQYSAAAQSAALKKCPYGFVLRWTFAKGWYCKPVRLHTGTGPGGGGHAPPQPAKLSAVTVPNPPSATLGAHVAVQDITAVVPEYQAGPLGCGSHADCGGYGQCVNGKCEYPILKSARGRGRRRPSRPGFLQSVFGSGRPRLGAKLRRKAARTAKKCTSDADCAYQGGWCFGGSCQPGLKPAGGPA